MGSTMTKPSRRRSIWRKAKGCCAHCGKVTYGNSQTIDHFIPKSRGGTYDKRNLMPLCRECNQNRKSKPVNPALFYAYASDEAIRSCMAYEREFNRSRRNMCGDIL